MGGGGVEGVLAVKIEEGGRLSRVAFGGGGGAGVRLWVEGGGSMSWVRDG